MSPRALIPGVRIEVISNNQSLKLYADPEAEEREDTMVPALYVEAVTGATFELRVTLEKEFVRGPCDAVRVGVKYDGEVQRHYQCLLPKATRHGRIATFSKIKSYNTDLGRWQHGSTAFGQLNTSQYSNVAHPVETSLNISTAEAVCGPSPKELQDLGTISVKVQRVRDTGSYKAPYQPGKSPQQRIDNIPEKALKGRAISHSVELIGSSKCRPPTYRKEVMPISGRLGQPLLVNIMYRSRRTLQMFGCISRTPSPERGSSVDEAEGTRQKIERLKARLASIERRTSVKVEAHGPEQSIKRERGADHDGSRKRPRKDGPAQVIDLTVD